VRPDTLRAERNQSVEANQVHDDVDETFSAKVMHTTKHVWKLNKQFNLLNACNHLLWSYCTLRSQENVEKNLFVCAPKFVPSVID